MSDDVFIDMMEDDSNTPPAELFCPKCGENIMSMSVHYCATPPAPVEEWEPLAVIRRLADLYRSNKSDTEVSARAMVMIQEFGARLSRSAPLAERPTLEEITTGATTPKTMTVLNTVSDACERPTPITDAALHSGGQWIQKLADVARNLERQLAEAREETKHVIRAHDAAQKHAHDYREQRDRLAEAISFYADLAKYPSPYTGGMGSLYFDCGKIARDALKGKTE